MADGHVFQGDDLGLLEEFEAEVEDEEDGDVDVGGDEGFCVPAICVKGRKG